MSISIWTNTANFPDSKLLMTNHRADVCVVGGGLGGLATAYLLQKEGKSVCLLEAYTLGSGQSGLSTAHATTALEDRYFHLEALHGTLGVALAAQSHQIAMDLIEHIAHQEKIDCDLERLNGYLFLDPKDSSQLLSKELSAIGRAGLNEVYAASEIPNIPFSSGPALCFPRQIQFHPLKFLAGLSRAFSEAGGMIYTHTPVAQIQGGANAFVLTDSGFKVQCDSIVVATHTPINDYFAIHSKQAAYRTYVIAARIPRNYIGKNLYWDTEEPAHYIRTQPDPNDLSRDLLIVGGEDHKTGQNSHPEVAYAKLELWMRSHFPEAKEIVYQWSGQFMKTIDGIAFLGHNPMDRNNVYVITGDSGNGMTHCMIGAALIKDQIVGRPNPWESLYHPSRKNLRAIKDYIRENANVAAQYGAWFRNGDASDMDEIKRGEGAIVREGARLIAAYRDSNEMLTTLSASCPHLGGVVQWNSAEKTWDCPCHGSRFDVKGKVIEGPACSHLVPYQKEHGDRLPILPPRLITDIHSAV